MFKLWHIKQVFLWSFPMGKCVYLYDYNTLYYLSQSSISAYDASQKTLTQTSTTVTEPPYTCTLANFSDLPEHFATRCWRNHRPFSGFDQWVRFRRSLVIFFSVKCITKHQRSIYNRCNHSWFSSLWTLRESWSFAFIYIKRDGRLTF